MLTRYSHSALDTFQTCPRRFKFKHLDKVDVPSRETADQRLGNAVHRQLQTAYQWAFDGKLITLDQMLDRFNSEWNTPEARKVEVLQEHMTVDDYITIGRTMLSRYYEKFQPFKDGVLLGAELNLSFSLPGTRFQFRGFVDRLWRRPDNVVEIWDYKTGNTLPKGPGDPAFRRQMALYQIGVQAMYPDFTDIELVQYYLKHGELIRSKLREDELDELVEQFRQEVHASIEAERLDNFPAVESGLCIFCEYFQLCPAKRHRLILEKEGGEDGKERATMETAAELAEKYIALDLRLKELKNEHNALKEDIINAARELQLQKLVGSTADITVKLATEEKLPTRTDNPNAVAELSQLIRQWGLDECFTLDNTVFLRDVYRKGLLNEEQLKKLSPYLVEKEASRVSVRRRKQVDDDD